MELLKHKKKSTPKGFISSQKNFDKQSWMVHIRFYSFLHSKGGNYFCTHIIKTVWFELSCEVAICFFYIYIKNANISEDKYACKFYFIKQ
jgi:hypothetical protein